MAGSAAGTGDRPVVADGLSSPQPESPDQASKSRPPPESASSVRTRRLIIIAFWTIVVFFGLPHWIRTTSTHRSNLPLERMNSWADGKACQLRYPINVVLNAPQLASQQSQGLAREVQGKLTQGKGFALYDYHVTAGVSGKESKKAALTVEVEDDGMSTVFTTKLQPWESKISVRYSHTLVAQLVDRIAKEVQSLFADEEATVSYMLQDTAFSQGHRAKHLDEHRRDLLDKRNTRAFKYASTYYLTFSLFAASAAPSSWDIEEAFELYMAPLLGPLSAISQYKIDTQVQLYASFSPSIAGPQLDKADARWKLQLSDLSGFINAAEWPLSPSIGAGPTINFVLYVPAPEQRPLTIAETGGSNWIIPQWGGVQILNVQDRGTHNETLSTGDLQEVMLTFADQLTSLLGVPPSPSSLAMRVSSLTRERTTSLMLSASSTLGALARLTLKLTSIAIPDTVAKAVDETLYRLDQTCDSLRQGDYEKALEHARIAEEEAERAFFEPSMVGQVYFPDEHKVAVYVPLLGPMSVPLIMTAVKELKSLRDRRKVKTT